MTSSAMGKERNTDRAMKINNGRKILDYFDLRFTNDHKRKILYKIKRGRVTKWVRRLRFCVTVTPNKFSSQSLGTCDEPKVEIVQYDSMSCNRLLINYILFAGSNKLN